MKKLTSILLLIALLVTTFCLTGCNNEQTAETETAEVKTFGDYEYIELDDGTLELTAYLGKEEAPELPAQIEGKNVTSIGAEAFNGCLSIKTLTVPEGITSIGDYAFECCECLTQATLPTSLRSLGMGAFSGCVMLETVTLPEGITEIGDGAFFYCKHLSSIELPDALETVGEFVFAECGSLREAKIGSGLKKLGTRMFWGDMSLQSVELSEGLEAIGDLAFFGCEMLSNVTFPESLQEIGKNAFRTCGGLTEITVSVPTVGAYAFYGCYGLQHITLTDSVQTIEPYAFANVGCEDSFYLPASVTDIQDCALCSVRTPAFTVAEDNPNYAAINGVLTDKDGTRLISYPTDREGTSYAIPDGITSIAPFAFSGVYLLESLTIPASVTTLEDGAFKELANLPELTIPATVTKMGTCVFEGMNTETIRLDAAITDLPEGTFRSCGAMTITLPETLQTIGKDAFVGAGNVTELTLPQSLTAIESGALAGTSGSFVSASENFKFENGGLYSADGKTLYCLRRSEEETAITVPDGVETVEPYAIDCREVQSVTVPASLQAVGEYGIGYRFTTYDQIAVDPVIGLRIYGEDNAAVRAYAADNNLGFFTAEPAQNITEVTLAGNETAQLVIENANPDDVWYSSFNNDIVSVKKDGTITAHKQGEAVVCANVGTTYFKCNVTVTSDGDANPDAFDASKYRGLSKDEVPAWMEEYFKLNEGNVSMEHDNNAFSSAYKGENYYEGIWAAQLDESEYDKGATSMFGEGFRPQMRMMGHGLATELSAYETGDDLVLYSGTVDFGRFLGGRFTMENLKASIGTTITEPYFLSTALQESVTPTFAGPYCSVFIIYADKELVEGGYIEGTVGQGAGGEYEILMLGGTKMEVIDAGVREITLTDDWTGEVSTRYETYMKVRLVPKD